MRGLISLLSLPASKAIDEGSIDAVEMEDAGDLMGCNCDAYADE